LLFLTEAVPGPLLGDMELTSQIITERPLIIESWGGATGFLPHDLKYFQYIMGKFAALPVCLVLKIQLNILLCDQSIQDNSEAR
jgi:hypothetical protein